MRCGRALLFKEFLYQTVQYQEWSATLPGDNLDVLPADPAPPASVQCFQGRFFGRKASGIMLCGHRATAIAIGSFSGSEYTISEARRAREHFANAGDFDNVYANGNDHGSCGTKKRRFLLART